MSKIPEQELAEENFVARFEVARDTQNFRDMNDLFAEMHSHDYGELAKELKNELNDAELASYAHIAHILHTKRGMDMMSQAMGLPTLDQLLETDDAMKEDERLKLEDIKNDEI